MRKKKINRLTIKIIIIIQQLKDFNYKVHLAIIRLQVQSSSNFLIPTDAVNSTVKNEDLGLNLDLI